MTLELSSHFVAFIDILGFSEMVRADCESSSPPKHLELLYNAHLRAVGTLGRDLDAGLIQFSDSIVFSRPFDLSQLDGFVSAVAAWQQSLLVDGLLCRGGVTFGKHFVKDRFMFSKGLIEAYHLENMEAKYPRIVVSENLLQLAAPAVDTTKLKLIREDDGIAFVDYLYHYTLDDRCILNSAIARVIEEAKFGVASVQEKMRWLARYSDYRLGSTFSGPMFMPL